jgi:cysteine desulfurase/selenocysteine lyase
VDSTTVNEFSGSNDRLPIRAGSEARSFFPFFQKSGAGECYLDSAATTQKPQVVLSALMDVLTNHCANVHRGAYGLSAVATEMYDQARGKVARFIGAPSEKNIVFVRGATEAINLVAYASEHLLQSGDVVLLSLLEHHSNIVPWQLLAQRKGVKIVFTEISDDGRFLIDDFRSKVKELKPKIVAITQLANSLGTITPIEEIVQIAKAGGARVLVDGAQGVSHLGIDVQKLGCDFYVFSGHKLYGPTGIGVLYGSTEALESLKPWQGGGDMISYVSVEGSGWAEIPQRFEAGTPAFAEAIALGAAIDFLSRVDRKDLRDHELALVNEASEILLSTEGVKLYGPGVKSGLQTTVVSFSIDGVHPHDLATIADEHHVQVRAGNHCAMPTLRRLGVQATARISFGVYSCSQDLVPLKAAINHARKLFGS